eukprot:11049812-Alexandrium_andersonii.AAC.1
MPRRSLSRGRSAVREPKAEPTDTEMPPAPEAAAAVASPAPVAEAASSETELGPAKPAVDPPAVDKR